MSASAREAAQVHVTGTGEQVGALLLDVARMPAWNPAIGAVRPAAHRAQIGSTYCTRIRGLVPARIEYVDFRPGLLRYEIAAAGSLERGLFEWSAAARGGTDVTHSFTHEGTLAARLRRGFVGVAHLGLARLAGALAA